MVSLRGLTLTAARPRIIVPLFARDPAKLDKARYQAYEQFLFDNKLIKKITPVEQYAVELN